METQVLVSRLYCYKFAALSQNKNVLYITGEESINQTKLRADRLEEDSSHLNVLAETDLEVIHQTVKEET